MKAFKMQNPVFIQFKDFLKRSNSMVRSIDFWDFFTDSWNGHCRKYLVTDHPIYPQYGLINIYVSLCTIRRDLNGLDIWIRWMTRWIMKYLLVINSKLYTQYQSDFLVFSHARTLRFCLGRFIKLSSDLDGLSAV